MRYRYWLLVLLGLCACVQETVVEVFVSGLSTQVTALQVTAQQGNESESQNFQQNLTSFAIRLPPGTEGPLKITVLGQTAQLCTVVVGQQEVPLVPSGYTSTTMTLAPAPLAVSSFSPTQGPSTGGPEITITGQGFGPGSVVRFDGIKTETVRTSQTSSCQLTAFLPTNPGASRTVSVTVSNPNEWTASSAGRFSYYLGQLAFERQPPTTFPSGKYPRSVAMGDVNGDGHLDLAVANYGANTVSVLLGRGDGIFLPKQDFQTGTYPHGVAIGDVNGDGHPDLAVANWMSNTVSVLLGKGDGTFLPKQDFQTGRYPESVTMGDVNGDGYPDLAVVTVSDAIDSGMVSVLLGKGDGIFLPKQDFQTGNRPASVAMGDVNGDSHPDLAVANSFPNTVSVLLGKGDGTFLPKQDFPTGNEPISLAMGDVNRDGHPDLAVVNHAFGSRSVSVLLGKGNGTFLPKQYFPTDNEPISLAMGDVNGDGHPDLAVVNFDDSTVNVLAGKGDGTFLPKPDFQTGTYPQSVAMGDVNGDGHPDLAVANARDNTVSVLAGKGDGTFLPKQDFQTGTYPRSVAMGDVNGDRRPDLTVANSFDNTVSVLLGKGDGTFLPKQDFQTGVYPLSVAMGDVNGDGHPDLAVLNYAFNMGTVSVLLGKGDGTFLPKQDFQTGISPNSVAMGDVNGDGHPDLAVVSDDFDSGTVSVLLGKGDGTFLPKQDFPTGKFPNSVAMGDMNGDGHPDLAVAHADLGDKTVSVLLGKGDGTFLPKQEIQTGSGPSSVAMGDVNGDGHPDLAVANFRDNTVSVLLSKGDGTFLPKQDFPTEKFLQHLALGDVNGDGHPDLAIVYQDANTVSLLLNTSQ